MPPRLPTISTVLRNCTNASRAVTVRRNRFAQSGELHPPALTTHRVVTLIVSFFIFVLLIRFRRAHTGVFSSAAYLYLRRQITLMGRSHKYRRNTVTPGAELIANILAF